MFNLNPRNPRKKRPFHAKAMPVILTTQRGNRCLDDRAGARVPVAASAADRWAHRTACRSERMRSVGEWAVCPLLVLR